VISYELYCKIRLYHQERGLSFAQISRELDIDQETVAKWARRKSYSARCQARRKSKLDPYKPIIQRWLERHPYTATQIFQRLRAEEAYTGGFTILTGLSTPSAAGGCASVPHPGVCSWRMRASRLGLRGFNGGWLDPQTAVFLCYGALL
jgi:putative ATPase subunit gpP of terminase